jgi:hypothetical protein
LQTIIFHFNFIYEILLLLLIAEIFIFFNYFISCVFMTIYILRLYLFLVGGRGRCGRHCIVVGFTTIYAISGSWIYNYLCNQCLSPLNLNSTHVEVYSLQHYVIKVCQWLAVGQCFSPRTLVSSTNKTNHQDITEILLKVALNFIT